MSNKRKFNILYSADKQRNRGVRLFLYLYRKSQTATNRFQRRLCRMLTLPYTMIKNIEIPTNLRVGGGLYIGHPYCIVINPNAVIGWNVNIHKGVTIGQENRGRRKGCPTIGNEVYIGVNATVVGNIRIGNDVLIAPNCYVNRDVPDHSIVIGNPCIIKHKENATEGYINNKVEISCITEL